MKICDLCAVCRDSVRVVFLPSRSVWCGPVCDVPDYIRDKEVLSLYASNMFEICCGVEDDEE